MTDSIRRFDGRVDAAFDSLRGNPVADRVFYTASSLGEFGLVWVMLALVRWLRGRPGDQRAAIRAIVSVGIESIFVNAGLKTIFARPRPLRVVEHPFPFRQPLTSSFPSGHATSSFCAATLLSEDEPLGPVYFAIGTVISASRVYTKIHHASDVLGGMVIGTCVGLAIRRLAPLRSKRAS
jgi:undecaprenyl-diphosphatase